MLLVDTNIVSELMRPNPNRLVREWASGLAELTVSVITVEEVHFGLALKPNVRLASWFQSFLAVYCDVLPITDSIARRSAQLRARLRAQGKPRTQADMLIAATACEHDLTVVTRNVRDFDGCGIALLNPFVR